MAFAAQEIIFIVGCILHSISLVYFVDIRRCVTANKNYAVQNRKRINPWLMCEVPLFCIYSCSPDRLSFHYYHISDNIIPLISSNFPHVGKALVLYLLKGLPMNTFHLSTNDLHTIKSWLFLPMVWSPYANENLPLLQQSDEFVVANFIMENTNWGLESLRKGTEWWSVSIDSPLFINAAMQREYALMLTEVFPNYWHYFLLNFYY